MATKGKLIEQFVENIHERTVAKSGILDEGVITVGAASNVVDVNALMGPAAPLRDGGLNVTGIQNADGSFKSMAGYDYPAG